MTEGDVLPVELMARREDWSDGISIFMRQRTVGAGVVVAAPVEMVPYKEGAIIDPMVRVGVQAAQQLMDELWQCGLRPTEGTGSAGSLAATERHLNDMRHMVLALMQKDGTPVERT